MPHLIKLCRNAIFNYGFILPDGTKVDKATFAEIEKVVEAGGEIFGAFKLKNPKIFNVRSMDKQKVRLACQLLSKTMSDFIKMNFKGNAQMLKIADFILLVNNWFDCLNSNRVSDLNPLKNAYGLHLDAQKSVIREMKSFVQKIKVLNKRNLNSAEIKLMPWQKGIGISCTALEMLFDDLSKKYQIKSIFGNRINQDPAEQHFAILRQFGGNNPRFNSVEFKYRETMVCMGVGQDLIIETANVEFPKEGEPKPKLITPDI